MKKYEETSKKSKTSSDIENMKKQEKTRKSLKMNERNSKFMRKHENIKKH